MGDDLPLIVLRGLDGNEAPTLTGLQQALAPHVGTIVALEWAAWALVLAFVVVRHVWPAWRSSRATSR